MEENDFVGDGANSSITLTVQSAFMKRFILIFLLGLLPLQMSWAVVTGYCQHEEGKAAQHFGHHEHKHDASSGNKQNKGNDKKSGFAFNDADCGCHHLCCATIISSEHRQLSFSQNSTSVEFQLSSYQSHLPDGPLKPDWRHAS